MQDQIFNIQSKEEFKQVALDVFKHQFTNNKVYRSFCDLLYVHPSDVTKIEEIPFLPIQFFKTKEILTSTDKIKETFTSSGTTGSITSKHHVTDLSWYETSYLKGFNYEFYDGETHNKILDIIKYSENIKDGTSTNIYLK